MYSKDNLDYKSSVLYMPSRKERRVARWAERREERRAADAAAIEEAVNWIESVRFNRGQKMRIFLCRVQMHTKIPRPIISEWLREHGYAYSGIKEGWKKGAIE